MTYNLNLQIKITDGLPSLWGVGMGSVHLFLVVVPTFKKTCVDPLISEKELYKSVKS